MNQEGDSGGRKGKPQCGSEGSRIRAYECPRWSPAAASRKIHRRQAINRNVMKKFVRMKMQTPILGCGRTHRECGPPVLHPASKTVQALTPSRSTQIGAALDREKRSRLVCVALPLREQCELGRRPIGAPRRHCGGLAIVRGDSREHFVCVVRIRHVGVTVEFYAESFHVRNVNGAKQRFDIR